jgi:hypothetical protein
MNALNPREMTPRAGDPGLLDPASGLAGDYLNQFHEVLMLLESAIDDPDFIEDLSHWYPRSYVGHFGASRLVERARVIDAYMHCAPVTRRMFDTLCTETSAMVSTGLDALIRAWPAGGPAVAPAARVLAGELRLAITRLQKIIHPEQVEPFCAARARAVPLGYSSAR